MIGDEQEPDDCTWSHIINWPHGDQPEPVGRSLSVIPDWVINKTPRPSAGRVTFSTWKFFDKDSPLLDSGLLGPVKLDAAHRFILEPSSKSEAHKNRETDISRDGKSFRVHGQKMAKWPS